MAYRTNWMVAALVATASLLQLLAQDNKAQAVQRADATAPKKAAQMTIGVVDLSKVFDVYGKAIAERERLQALSQKFTAELGAISKQFDALRSDLSLRKEGSEERETMEFELRMLSEQRRGLIELRKNQFDREFEKYELAIYKDLEVACAEVAKVRGVQVLLRMQPTPSFDDGAAKDPLSLQRAQWQGYDRRQVWFASDEVDLTQAIIKYLSVPVDAKPVDAKGADAKNADAQKPGTGAKDGGL